MLTIKNRQGTTFGAKPGKVTVIVRLDIRPLSLLSFRAHWPEGENGLSFLPTHKRNIACNQRPIQRRCSIDAPATVGNTLTNAAGLSREKCLSRHFFSA